MVAVCDFRLFPRTSVLQYCFKARWFARCFQFPTPLLFGFKRILQTLAVTVVQVTWSSISQIVVSPPGWLVSDTLSRQPEVTPRFFGQSKDMSLEDVIKSKAGVFALDWNQVKLYKSLDIRNAKCFQELSNCHEISISPPFFYKTCGLPINACSVDWTAKLTVQVATASVQLAAPRWSIRIGLMDVDGQNPGKQLRLVVDLCFSCYYFWGVFTFKLV